MQVIKKHLNTAPEIDRRNEEVSQDIFRIQVARNRERFEIQCHALQVGHVANKQIVKE